MGLRSADRGGDVPRALPLRLVRRRLGRAAGARRPAPVQPGHRPQLPRVEPAGRGLRDDDREPVRRAADGRADVQLAERAGPLERSRRRRRSTSRGGSARRARRRRHGRSGRRGGDGRRRHVRAARRRGAGRRAHRDAAVRGRGRRRGAVGGLRGRRPPRRRSTGRRAKDAPSGGPVGGAIAATISLAPGESRTIPFVLAWDVPQAQFATGTRWHRRYTAFFGTSGRNAWAIAAEGARVPRGMGGRDRRLAGADPRRPGPPRLVQGRAVQRALLHGRRRHALDRRPADRCPSGPTARRRRPARPTPAARSAGSPRSSASTTRSTTRSTSTSTPRSRGSSSGPSSSARSSASSSPRSMPTTRRSSRSNGAASSPRGNALARCPTTSAGRSTTRCCG